MEMNILSIKNVNFMIENSSSHYFTENNEKNKFFPFIPRKLKTIIDAGLINSKKYTATFNVFPNNFPLVIGPKMSCKCQKRPLNVFRSSD